LGIEEIAWTLYSQQNRKQKTCGYSQNEYRA